MKKYGKVYLEFYKRPSKTDYYEGQRTWVDKYEAQPYLDEGLAVETSPKASPRTSSLQVDFEDLPGAEALKEAGYDTFDKVGAATDEQLLKINGIGKATLNQIRDFYN